MRVYADNAATTKLSPAAKEAMLPYFDEIYGNPSTLYTLGQEAAEHLLACRTRWRTVRCACPWANTTQMRKWHTSWTMSGRWSPICAASPRCGTSWRPGRARI